MTSYSSYKLQLMTTGNILLRKINKQDSKLDKLAEMLKNIMDHIQNPISSPDKMDPPKSQDSTTAVP